MSVRRRFGLTLMELLVVVAILAALAGIVVPQLTTTSVDTQITATQASLSRLRDVILGVYRLDMDGQLPRPGYTGLTAGRNNAPQLRYLYWNPGPSVAPGATETTASSFDPVSKRGWRGPYVLGRRGKYVVDNTRNFKMDYGLDLDDAPLDSWDRPFVITPSGVVGMQWDLRSAGPDGVLSPSVPISDDVVLALY